MKTPERTQPDFDATYVRHQHAFYIDLVDKFLEYDGRKNSKHWLAAFACDRQDLLNAAFQALIEKLEAAREPAA